MFEIGTIGYLVDNSRNRKKSGESPKQFIYTGKTRGHGIDIYVFVSLSGGYKVSVTDRDFKYGFYSFDEKPTRHAKKSSRCANVITIQQSSIPRFMSGNTFFKDDGIC